MALVVVRLSPTVHPRYHSNHFDRPTSLSSCLLRSPRVPPLLDPLRPLREPKPESSNLCDTFICDFYEYNTILCISYLKSLWLQMLSGTARQIRHFSSGMSVCLWVRAVPIHQRLHFLQSHTATVLISLIQEHPNRISSNRQVNLWGCEMCCTKARETLSHTPPSPQRETQKALPLFSLILLRPSIQPTLLSRHSSFSQRYNISPLALFTKTAFKGFHDKRPSLCPSKTSSPMVSSVATLPSPR